MSWGPGDLNHLNLILQQLLHILTRFKPLFPFTWTIEIEH